MVKGDLTTAPPTSTRQHDRRRMGSASRGSWGHSRHRPWPRTRQSSVTDVTHMGQSDTYKTSDNYWNNHYAVTHTNIGICKPCCNSLRRKNIKTLFDNEKWFASSQGVPKIRPKKKPTCNHSKF